MVGYPCLQKHKQSDSSPKIKYPNGISGFIILLSHNAQARVVTILFSPTCSNGDIELPPGSHTARCSDDRGHRLIWWCQLCWAQSPDPAMRPAACGAKLSRSPPPRLRSKYASRSSHAEGLKPAEALPLTGKTGVKSVLHYSASQDAERST